MVNIISVSWYRSKSLLCIIGRVKKIVIKYGFVVLVWHQDRKKYLYYVYYKKLEIKYTEASTLVGKEALLLPTTMCSTYTIFGTCCSVLRKKTKATSAVSW